MSKMLAILSVTGLALCACFLGLAFAIGGDDVFRNQRSLENIKPLIEMATRKEWRWGGGDTLALNAPMNVRYEPKGPPGVSVTGPAELVKDMRLSEGRIASDSTPRRREPKNSEQRVEAVVSGVAIRKFVVNGSENLDLGRVEQKSLEVHVNGDGSVRGEGRVEGLNLVIAGAGNADLGKLSVTADAKVSILGSGNASLAPKGDLRLFIAGPGKLQLLSTPKSISRTILGSGEVTPPSAAPPPAPPAPPAPMEMMVPAPSSNEQVYSNTSTGEFIARGSRDTNFGRIERQEAKITVLNSGSVSAYGKVDSLTVRINGSGEANLGRLAAREINITIAGSGEAVIAPSETVKVTILGSGTVRLVTKPQRIDRSIRGSGDIIEAR